MTPFFFGRTAQQLYGFSDEPSGAAQDTAVVLAYPAFSEYNKAHWVFRRLAERIAAEGFFVLRFDYFGTGDSAGDSAEGSLAQWRDDIATAADEALDISGARELSVVGMGLGATLAAQTVEAGLDVRDLVLWDPVVSGPSDLERQIGRARIQRRVRLLSARRPERQLLGYPFPEHMHEEMRAIDLSGIRLDRAERVTIIATRDHARAHTLGDALGRQHGAVAQVNLGATARGSSGREAIRLSTEPIEPVIAAIRRAALG